MFLPVEHSVNSTYFSTYHNVILVSIPSFSHVTLPALGFWTTSLSIHLLNKFWPKELQLLQKFRPKELHSLGPFYRCQMLCRRMNTLLTQLTQASCKLTRHSCSKNYSGKLDQMIGTLHSIKAIIKPYQQGDY